CLRTGNARQVGLDLPETSRARFAWNGLGKQLEIVQRSRAHCLEQCLVDGLNAAEAMYLESSHIKERHLCKGAHQLAVAQDALLDTFARGRLLVPGLTRSQNQRGSHPLQIPLEWTADGFVEVVDVENQ